MCTAIRSACCIYDELPDATASIVRGSGIRFFCVHGKNKIRINPRLLDRARAAYVAIEDICFTVTDDSDARRLVHVHAQMHLDRGNINITYTLDACPPPKEIRVRVHVCGSVAGGREQVDNYIFSTRFRVRTVTRRFAHPAHTWHFLVIATTV